MYGSSAWKYRRSRLSDAVTTARVLEWAPMERGMCADRGVLSLIIVAREQQDLWRCLVHEFQGVPQIEILLDRRYGERRTPLAPVAYDRRASERRSVTTLEDDLRARQYVLVRPHHRRPHA